MTAKRDYSLPASEEAIRNTVKALEANGFQVQLVDTLKDAKTAVLDLIPTGSQVFTATSETLRLSGLTEELNSSKYTSVRDEIAAVGDDPARAVEKRRVGSAMEYIISSVHALTEDGQAVIASLTGSQLSGIAYGASHVIWVIGSQKIVKDLNEAMDRLENYTFHLEDKRALEAYGMNSALSKVLLYRKELFQRVQIVICKEAIGY